MCCPSCVSGTEAQFATEMMVHFPGPKNPNNPGVFIFAKGVGGLRLVAVLNSGKQIRVARSSDGQQGNFDVSGKSAVRPLRQTPASAG
jgi:hypothetical protein